MINNFGSFSLTAAPEASPLMPIIMMVIFFGVFYFFIIKPQKKKDKETLQMRNSIAAGDEVITIGGIHGKVVKASEESIVIELSHGKQRMTFSKWAIGSVTKKGKDTDTHEIEETDSEDKSE